MKPCAPPWWWWTFSTTFSLAEVEYETVVVRGPASKSIVDYAREHDCDLVVLATHGLTGVEHALMGSVAERVVPTADVPVLTVRAPM